MNQRRHATVILFGESFQTFTPMQAFQQSVHAVINSSELFLLKQLIEKAVADNTMFLHSYPRSAGPRLCQRQPLSQQGAASRLVRCAARISAAQRGR